MRIIGDVIRTYNGFGQLTREHQDHDSAVSTSSGLATVYSYAGGDKGSRLSGITYPSGKVISYNYGSTGTLNDVISRLDNLAESG